MNNNQRSTITPLELDAGPRSAFGQAQHPPSFLPEPPATDDEAAALLSGTDGPSVAAHEPSSAVSSSRHRRGILLTTAVATVCLLLAFALTAVAVGRRPHTAEISTVAAPPAETAAPPRDTAAPATEVADVSTLAAPPTQTVAPPENSAAPVTEAAVPWGVSLYDVPVPQNVSMPPYTTNVRRRHLQPGCPY